MLTVLAITLIVGLVGGIAVYKHRASLKAEATTAVQSAVADAEKKL